MALTRISSDQIEPGSITAELLAPGAGAGPVIANVQIANSSYSALDDTAVALAGGYIILNGSNFGSNTQVIIGNTIATSVTYVSATEIRAQVPAKSAGSYIVYLINADTGATAIRVNGLTYSGVPSWSTDSTLTEGAVDEAISIQLSASSDTSVTYQLQTGSTLPTGLTLAANGLLSGTITGVTEETLYNFTIEAVDAENQESPRAFSITITAGDQYINSVVLALNADTNTFITDASTNSFAITPNGDTRPSAFSPYNTNWSNYFDGTGDYLQLPTDTAFAFGTGDFTCESWVYITSAPAYAYALWGDIRWATGYSSGWYTHINSGLTITARVSGSTGAWVEITSTDTVNLNSWNHIAFSRQSGTFRIFVNGVISGSSSGTSYNYTNAEPFKIGAAYIDGILYALNGYISNLRVVKGTAVYTSNFTPPTSPLTAISDTSLLTCQSNRLIDNSTNNFTITRNGDVRVTSFGPFTETDATTGSGYFDGTGDWLNLPVNTAFDLPGDFTIECWANFSALASNRLLVDTFISGDSGSYQVYWRGTGSSIAFYTVGDNVILQDPSSSTIVIGRWHHIAVTRSGTTARLFIDGDLKASATLSRDLTHGNVLTLGRQNTTATNYLNGYLSNVRIVKGSAVYTSNFTPPTSPLTAIANTSLLTLQNRISYNNSQPIDESGVKNIVTRNGNASIGSYTPHTPAGWSAYFDGSGDYLTTSSSTLMDVTSSSQTFTIEAWIYPTAINASGPQSYRFTSILSKGVVYLSFGYTSTGVLRWYTFNGSENYVNSSAGVILQNQWQHVAVVSNGGSITLYANGQSVATGSLVTPNGGTGVSPKIGHADPGMAPDALNGYISNLRTTTTAVYTSNFTPSTTPLEPIANTSLLTLRGPSFTDDGPNRFTITRNGDTRITPFSPFKTHTIVPDSHSVYFDGTGDYLTTSTVTALQMDADFTWEAWVYPLSNPSAGNYKTFWAQRATSGGFGGPAVVLDSSGNFLLFISNAAASAWSVSGFDTGLDVSLNEWQHIALVKNGTTVTLYKNGTAGTSTTHSTAVGTSGNTSLMSGAADGAQAVDGYVSNFRAVKGTALYTSNFTPSTTPLTNIANTSLLTCQSSTVVDNSNNAFAITVNGNAQPTKFNPFGETATIGVQYSSASHGGSYYFDGTGDYLTLPTSTALQPETGDYTIELFYNSVVQAAAGDNYRTIFSYGTGLRVFFYNSNGIDVWEGASNKVRAASVSALNQWNHLAICRSGSTTYVFYNGTSIGSFASTTNLGGTLEIGRDSNIPMFYGHISNFRVIKGSALYTSAFVPPAAPPSPVAGTTLLLNGTGAAIADGVGKNVLETIGTARQVSDTKKFGTGSIYIPDTTAGFKTDGVNLPGDFTIEFWVKALTVGAENFLIVQGVNQTNGFLIGATRAYIRFRSNGTSDILSSSFSNTDWYHVAVVRSGSSTNNVKVYYNGTSVAQGTYTNQILASVGSLHIGPSNLLASGFATYGYVDDFRITAGVARYTSNFTPPTSSLKLK